MHICMVTSDFPPKLSGLGYYVYNLSKELTRKGHKVTVVTRGSWKGLQRNYVKGISVHRLQFLPLYPYHVKLHEIILTKALKSLEPSLDVVHVHHPLSPIVHTSLPVVVTVHTIGLSQASLIELTNFHSLVTKLFSNHIERHIEARTLHNADIITSVSNKVAEEIQKYYGFDRKSVKIIGNAVDNKFFIPRENKNKDKTYVLYTGRLGYRKGLFDLVKSATYTCREHPEVSFVLTGKGPLERNLKRLVEKMRLSNKFCFAGYVDRKSLLNYYQNATVYVLSSYYEGLATSLLEAMSSGLPVVATAIDANIDVITSGVNGILVPPKAPQKIAGAVSKLLDDKDLREKIGRAARKTIEKFYTWDRVAEKTSKYYESLV